MLQHLSVTVSVQLSSYIKSFLLFPWTWHNSHPWHWPSISWQRFHQMCVPDESTVLHVFSWWSSEGGTVLMEEILHQLWDGKYPTIYMFLYLPCGWPDFLHQQCLRKNRPHIGLISQKWTIWWWISLNVNANTHTQTQLYRSTHWKQTGKTAAPNQMLDLGCPTI